MKIALFLGAGASVVYGKPTTVQFKDQLSQIVRNSDLHDELLKRLLRSNKFPDVEYILKSLEDIETFSESRGGLFIADVTSTSSEHMIMMFENTPYTYKELIDTSQKLKKTIETQIFKKYSWDHKKDDLLNSILNPILSELDARNNTVKIFTTNYDRVVEEFCSLSNDFYANDGFIYDVNSQRHLWNGGNYDELDNPDRINLQLYKLHGSLNWKLHTKYDIERTTTENESTVETNHTKDFLIYPTLSPKDGMVKEPYKTIRQKFQEYLNETDVCIVIGSSFRDEHLNEIFIKYTQSKKRLLVISPSADKDVGRWLKRDLEIPKECINFDVPGIDISILPMELELDNMDDVTGFLNNNINRWV